MAKKQKIQERKLKAPYERTRIKTAPCTDRKTRCVQSEAKAADINNIVAKAVETGQLPARMSKKPLEKFPPEMTYQDALDKVNHAREAFEQLPALTRDKFKNDPANLLHALENPKENLELLLEAQVLEEVKEVIDPVVAELQKVNENIKPRESQSDSEN